MVPRGGKDSAQTDMKGALIEAALALIDEAGGCRGVTLRAVASRAGCAHTNAYNYFASLDELFWECVLEAMGHSSRLIGQRLSQVSAGGAEVVGAIVLAQVEFAQTHPGWYRLIWCEPFGTEAPEHVLARLRQPRMNISQVLRPLMGEGVSDEDARRITDVTHSYVHGEISKLINRRDVADYTPGDPTSIQRNALRLIRLMAADAADGAAD